MNHRQAQDASSVNRIVRSVRLRLVILRCARAGGWACLAAAAPFAAWMAGHRWLGWPAPWLPGIVLPAVVAWGAVMGTRRIGPIDAAHAIDRSMRLKDRVVSALEFLAVDHPREAHRLQVADTDAHLKDARAGSIVPWHWKRDALPASVALALFLAGWIPPGPEPARAVPLPPAPRAMSIESAELTRQLIDLADDVPDVAQEPLRDTLGDMMAMAESLSRPGIDMESALETMGRMRRRLEEAVGNLDPAANEAMLAAMAETMNRFSHTRPVGRPLSRRQYTEAARQMQELADRAGDAASDFIEQSQELGEGLEVLSEPASREGRDALSRAMQKLSEGIREKNASACSIALSEQAGLMKQQGTRQAVAEALQRQLRRLAESKQNLGSAYCSACTGGGECEDESGDCRSGMSSAKLRESTGPSESTSDTAGEGDHDERFGDASELDTHRRFESVSGQWNAGPSRITVEQAPASGQFASTEYREVYSRYRKMSDDILEHEALPSGYHDVIRRYFESIRPAEDWPRADDGERTVRGDDHDR